MYPNNRHQFRSSYHGAPAMQLTSNLIAHLPRPLLDAIARARKNNAAFRRWSDSVADRLRGRDVTVLDGLAKGLVFNSGRSNVGYTYAHGALEPDSEQAILTVLQSGMTFYDIGANFGWLSLIAARIVGPQGKVLSFEPLDENAHIVEHNIRANKFVNVTVLPIALGNNDGPARFLLSSQPSWGMLADMGKKPGEFVGVTAVTARRLDTAVREYRLPAPQVIKIDVEGAEIDVLHGAKDTIAGSRPLMFIELHETNTAVADILTLYNYKVCLPGSSLSVVDAPGNVHVFAIPRERNDCKDLLRVFQDSAFPQCARCHEIGKPGTPSGEKSRLAARVAVLPDSA
jgi:FkbM family methyltransferase